MKYILKYKIKSKYFGFIREETKEFNSRSDIYQFILNKKITSWKIYERTNSVFYTTFGKEEPTTYISQSKGE